MALSKRALETLVDLVEIKLSCVEVYDREDARELQNLQICRDELVAMTKGLSPSVGDVLPIEPKRRRGRPRIADRAQA